MKKTGFPLACALLLLSASIPAHATWDGEGVEPGADIPADGLISLAVEHGPGRNRWQLHPERLYHSIGVCRTRTKVLDAKGRDVIPNTQ